MYDSHYFIIIREISLSRATLLLAARSYKSYGHNIIHFSTAIMLNHTISIIIGKYYGFKLFQRSILLLLVVDTYYMASGMQMTSEWQKHVIEDKVNRF